MGHIVYLTPTTAVPQSIVQLATECKELLLSTLYFRIVEETLRPNSINKTFSSKHGNWLATPEPKIIAINSLGVETLKFNLTDYTTSFTGGSVTFGVATTDTIRADYNYFPFTDQQLQDFTLKSLHEISSLIFRPIDNNNIPYDYAVAICKRLYTNLLKALLLEARDYFSVSVGGRSINKTSVVSQINAIIEQNERQLQQEIEVLRTFNKTNRLLPFFTLTGTIQSGAKVV